MSSTASVEHRSSAVRQLRQALTDAPLHLDVSGADRARHERSQLLDQIDDYLLPRLAQLDAPLLAVLGGSTGAGKSTLFNSILGDVVSAASVRRPTTRTPVLACHLDDQQWFTSDRVLPGLERITGDRGAEHRPGTLRIHATDTLPPGLALLDAPDIDSVETANRSMAEQLLAAADLWVFVTTAARYADAIPWEFLSTAAERGTVVALVLNRVPAGARDDVASHLHELMEEAGLGEADLFVVDEGPKSDVGLLTGDDLGALSTWVRRLAADADARATVAQRTLDGALRSLLPRTRELADAVRSERDAAARLNRDVDDAYAAAAEAIAERAVAGRALHTEVLGRWQELVGTGKIIGTVQRQVGRVRDAVAGAFGRRSETAAATGELTSDLERGIILHADEAALEVVEQWRDDSAGAALLGGDDVRLSRSDPDLAIKARAEIDQWSASIVALVGDQGKNRHVVARVLSIGVNTVGLALMVAVFAHTGGLTGGEVVVASGTGAASHALLTAVFGEQAVRDLVEQASGDLDWRIRRLLDDDAARFRRRITDAATGDDIAEQLDAAVDLLSESLGVSEPTLDERLTALEQAVGLAGARVSIPPIAEAAAVCERTRARLGHGTHHAVVAIAGPTGGGKSSLFNQLAGGELSPPGLRRPTTAAASAAVWGPDVEPLLRWLEITLAHRAPNQTTDEGTPGPLDGLVLIDLPDHDSIERSHQLEMERLTDLADLLLWVTDPQKYADASVHAYLRNLAGQDAAIVIVLNQIDLLTPAELDTCLSELTAILRDDGLAHVVVHPVSATTGTGVEQLESRLADVVSTRRAAVDRPPVLAVSIAADDLDRALDLDVPASGGNGDRDGLISEIAAAAGADAAGEAIAASHRRMAAVRTGWPVTRWIAAVRRDPLRTLRSASRPTTPLAKTGEATANPPEPQPEGWSVDRARIRAAVRTYVEQAVPTDSPTWQAVGRDAANQHGDALARTAEGTVAEATLEPTPLPRWWKLAAFVQRLAGIAALAGLAWLVAIAALEWAKVPQLPIPEVGDIPVPTALLLGGVLVGVLTAWISRGFAGVGAKRRAARARSRIETAVTGVADELVVTPIDAELADLRRLDELLGVAGT